MLCVTERHDADKQGVLSAALATHCLGRDMNQLIVSRRDSTTLILKYINIVSRRDSRVRRSKTMMMLCVTERHDADRTLGAGKLAGDTSLVQNRPITGNTVCGAVHVGKTPTGMRVSHQLTVKRLRWVVCTLCVFCPFIPAVWGCWSNPRGAHSVHTRRVQKKR